MIFLVLALTYDRLMFCAVIQRSDGACAGSGGDRNGDSDRQYENCGQNEFFHLNHNPFHNIGNMQMKMVNLFRASKLSKGFKINNSLLVEFVVFKLVGRGEQP